MSDHVVISKEFRDALIDDLSQLSESKSIDGTIQGLRTSPETVSLDGVPKRVVMWDGNPHECVKTSDLRRLVAPVQPSAVVSREAMNGVLLRISQLVCEVPNKNMGMDVKQDLTEKLFALFLALQLPQPVTPVQSGGVEFDDGWFDAQETRFAHGQYSDKDIARSAWDECQKRLSHLTTTQSAPSVESGGVDGKKSGRMIGIHGPYTSVSTESALADMTPIKGEK